MCIRDRNETAIVESMATLKSLRARVWQLLDNEEKSSADIRSVIVLGYEPNKILDELPDSWLASQIAAQLAAYLDTHGCVLFRQGNLELASFDFEASIIGIRAYIHSIEKFQLYHFDPMAMDIEHQYVDQPKESLATMLYHRSWIHHARGANQLKQADLDEIRKLGFTIGPELN